MIQEIKHLLGKLVQLAQERNTYALEAISEQRMTNQHLRSIVMEQGAQTELIKKFFPPAPSQLKRTVMIFGAVEQI